MARATRNRPVDLGRAIIISPPKPQIARSETPDVPLRGLSFGPATCGHASGAFQNHSGSALIAVAMIRLTSPETTSLSLMAMSPAFDVAETVGAARTSHHNE